MRLITKTAVELHPHGDVLIPCCGYQSDVPSFDWRNQRVFYRGVLITVSSKHLKISKINVNACILLVLHMLENREIILSRF